MMRKSTRYELLKLRELIHFALRGKCCCFCRKPILPNGTDSHISDGDGRNKPIATQITIHHRDWNHGNQTRSNKRLCHTKCHKAYNARVILHKRRVIIGGKRVLPATVAA